MMSGAVWSQRLDLSGKLICLTLSMDSLLWHFVFAEGNQRKLMAAVEFIQIHRSLLIELHVIH